MKNLPPFPVPTSQTSMAAMFQFPGTIQELKAFELFKGSIGAAIFVLDSVLHP